MPCLHGLPCAVKTRKCNGRFVQKVLSRTLVQLPHAASIVVLPAALVAAGHSTMATCLIDYVPRRLPTVVLRLSNSFRGAQEIEHALVNMLAKQEQGVVLQQFVNDMIRDGSPAKGIRLKVRGSTQPPALAYATWCLPHACALCIVALLAEAQHLNILH